MITYQLCALKLPFDGDNTAALVLQILRCVYDPLPSQFSQPLSRFIGHCLQPEPQLRASASGLVEQCRAWITQPIFASPGASSASASAHAQGPTGVCARRAKQPRAIRSLGSLAASLRKHAPRAGKLPSLRSGPSDKGRLDRAKGTLATHGLPDDSVGRAIPTGFRHRSASLDVHAPLHESGGRLSQGERSVEARLSSASCDSSAEGTLVDQWQSLFSDAISLEEAFEVWHWIVFVADPDQLVLPIEFDTYGSAARRGSFDPTSGKCSKLRARLTCAPGRGEPEPPRDHRLDAASISAVVGTKGRQSEGKKSKSNFKSCRQGSSNHQARGGAARWRVGRFKLVPSLVSRASRSRRGVSREGSKEGGDDRGRPVGYYTFVFWRYGPWIVSVSLMVGSHVVALWIALSIFVDCDHVRATRGQPSLATLTGKS